MIKIYSNNHCFIVAEFYCVYFKHYLQAVGWIKCHARDIIITKIILQTLTPTPVSHNAKLSPSQDKKGLLKHGRRTSHNLRKLTITRALNTWDTPPLLVGPLTTSCHRPRDCDIRHQTVWRRGETGKCLLFTILSRVERSEMGWWGVTSEQHQ